MAVQKWDDKMLESMRSETDPVADAVVAEIIDVDGLETVVNNIKQLVNNREIVPADMHPRVQRYFQETASLPDWADPQLIEKGEQVFELNGPEMIASLFFLALPFAYASRKGAHVLMLTARISQHTERRIFRTAQFIMDVMSDGGLGPEGRGIRSTQKIRLIHAAMRHYLLHRPQWREHWDMEWGMPLNQEDLAGTLMDFSSGVMRGLESIGIRLRPDEAEAYMHCWKVVGHILGVVPALIPHDVADGTALAETIKRRQWAPSEAGVELTASLVNYMQTFLPGTFLDGLIPTAMRHFLKHEQQAIEYLKVPPADWTRVLLRVQLLLIRATERWRHRTPGISHLVRVFFRRMVDGLLLVEMGGRRWTMDIPPGLRKTWRMKN